MATVVIFYSLGDISLYRQISNRLTEAGNHVIDIEQRTFPSDDLLNQVKRADARIVIHSAESRAQETELIYTVERFGALDQRKNVGNFLVILDGVGIPEVFASWNKLVFQERNYERIAIEIVGEVNRMALEEPSRFLGLPIAIAVALIAAASAVGAAYLSVKKDLADQQKDVRQQIQFLASATPGSLNNGQKLCRVLHKIWRDGVIVPQNWEINLCVDYMKKTGGTGYQLGCIYVDGTNLGKEDGSLPSPNCGWK